jgi:enterochelin esterase-like enzyme
VLYLLHGFPGSPYSFIAALQLAQTADTAIASGGLPPFIAVIPPAGFDAHHGAWTGIWEDFVVRSVVPWVDANLPSGHPRTLAGLSSGGYGALDIGLRHPGTFDRLEAWSGYFHPIREGSLLSASASELAAHDPSLLVSREGPLLRSAGVRFFLSAGTTQDRPTVAATVQFAAQLRRLGLQTSVWLGPGGHDSFFWRRQLPAALRFAVAPG